MIVMLWNSHSLSILDFGWRDEVGFAVHNASPVIIFNTMSEEPPMDVSKQSCSIDLQFMDFKDLLITNKLFTVIVPNEIEFMRTLTISKVTHNKSLKMH